jgi:uncharacterized surface protein with fasciclin (FAS1) repeats
MALQCNVPGLNPIAALPRIRFGSTVQTIPLTKEIPMRKITTSLLFAAILGTGTAAFANVTVGGQSMMPSKDIIDNAVNSADHTTLVAAVKAAGLVDTLKGSGPFTVFAPTNAAFKKLPAGTVESLLKPENKAALTNILTYHVVSGKYDFMALASEIKKHRGRAQLTTVNGAKLTFAMNGMHNIVVVDEAGGTANIGTYDVYQSNGVINVVDAVLMAK